MHWLILLILLVTSWPAWASEEIGRQEDSVSASGQVLMPEGCIRSDTLASTTDADGDYINQKCNALGRLYTSATIDAALPAGTNAIGKLSANSGVIIGDVNVVSASGLNIASQIPGTGSTNLGKAEDGVHVSGDTGVFVLGVRHDNSVTGMGSDGDYMALGIDSSGQLYTKADTEMPVAALLADSVANPTLPAVAAYLICYNGTVANTWSRCPGGLTDTDDGTVAVSQVPYLSLNLPYAFDGTNWIRPRQDPCESGNKIFVPVSQTTGTQLLTGTASMRTYVCSVHIVTATAQNVALVSGTGTVCATSLGAMAGGTTAATGWNLAANGGLVLGNGGATVAKSDTDQDNVCLLQSGSGQISGTVSYVAAAN